MSLVRLARLALLVAAAGCPGTTGGFDGGTFPDAGPVEEVTAQDIGTVCEYDASNGENPTNTCGPGLTCLIRTFLGEYTPFPAGSNANFGAHNWEDHFTIYRDDGIDEGYCTLVGTWDQPPLCPGGTTLKLLSFNLAVCLKDCVDATDCARSGYTCDARFLDVGPTCVRGCTLDYPECVRTGQFQRPQQQGGQTIIALHLEAADLAGASMCDVGTGICVGNPGGGLAAPGMPCNSTADCDLESVCIQSAVVQSVNPNLPANTPGFCAQPCKPDPQNPLSGGCRTGYACQAGLLLGHPGDPLDANVQDANGFLLINSAQQTFLEAGGWCFPDCQATGGVCDSHPGTQCGAADTNTFAQPWNQVSMCLLDPLRQ